MADEKTVTSADADVPEEKDVNETVEPSSVDEAVEPAAEAPAEEPVADAADEAVAETTGEPEVADATAETAAEPESSGTSANAEVPAAKPKKKRLPRSQRPQRTRPKRVKSAERKPMVRLEKPEHARGRRQERQGTVVSDAMEKTIVVKVEVVKAHPKYKKVVRRSVKFHAHDEGSAAKVGDVVRIVETRPLSKTKRWRLAEVVEAAK
jgi:small subunit ribosomal protein S17